MICADPLDSEKTFWQSDAAINARGVQIDVPRVHDCIAIIEQAGLRYNAELKRITDGVVEKSSSLPSMGNWLRNAGVAVTTGRGSMDEDAIARYLKQCAPHPPDGLNRARRVLEIRAIMGSASVKKVYAMANQCTRAGRVHDLFLYCGARTGRPTGSGPQPTNLPKAGPKVYHCKACNHWGALRASCVWCATPVPPGAKAKKWTWEAAEDALAAISSRSLDVVEHAFGDAMLTISGVLRSLFIAGPGKELISSDFSAIEAVVIAAIAGEDWRLEIFRTHGKIYEISAAKISGLTFAELMSAEGWTPEELQQPRWWEGEPAKKTGTKHPLRQDVGKVAELALGFGGSVGAWRRFEDEEKPPMAEDDILTNVRQWRKESPNIEWLWGGQHRGKADRIRRNAGMPGPFAKWNDDTPEFYGLEGMAIQAVRYPGHRFHVLRMDGSDTCVSFICQDDVLYCRLPSGRDIPYHRPRVYPHADAWRGLALQYEGWNSNPTNGAPGWIVMEIYGGKWAENITQAAARDQQRYAINGLEAAGYPVVMHVYDEDTTEVPIGWGSIEEQERIMMRVPTWARYKGRAWPIKAAGGWRAIRYRKAD